MARQLCVMVAMVGTPSLSMAQELAPAVRLVNPTSLQAQRLNSAQLSDLVAPVALYPDALLSQVLVASTYPLEVVEAQQWLRRNESLREEELMDGAREQRWDASVQGLVAFPDALSALNQDIQWTTALGNAFLAQESDVMAAVQRLRAQAQARGTLSSTPQQTVSAVAQEGRTVVEIVPADPQVIYVPQYDPYYVWGSPAWSAYPSLAYGDGYGYGAGINVGFWFGGWSWGWGWGWGPNWYGGSVYVNNAFFSHCGYSYGHHGGYQGDPRGGHKGGYGGGNGGGHNGGNNGGHGGGRGGGDPAGGSSGRETWQHDGGHRMGVPYSNSRLASQHQSASQASRVTMVNPGSMRRSGNGTTSPSGNRAVTSGSRSGGTGEAWRNGNRTVAQGERRGGTDQGWRAGNRAEAPVTRGGGMDQAWRAGSRTDASGSRGGGADRGWSSSGDQWRRSEGGSRSLSASERYSASSPRYSAPSPRYSESSPRYSASSPRSSAPSPSYSAPSRSFSSSAPTRGFQSAPRSSSPDGAGQSFGGGSSQRSGGDGGSRGASSGRGSGGGSHGGGRRR